MNTVSTYIHLHSPKHGRQSHMNSLKNEPRLLVDKICFKLMTETELIEFSGKVFQQTRQRLKNNTSVEQRGILGRVPPEWVLETCI